MEPNPFEPGVPVTAEPLAAVRANRLSPSLDKPAGFGKRTSCKLPTTDCVPEESVTLTVPSLPMSTAVASVGIVIAGSME